MLFEQKTLKDWQDLKDKDIDKILETIQKMPNFSELRDEVNEFMVALNMLKNSRQNKKFVETVHLRADKLKRMFTQLKSQFNNIYSEVEDFQQIDRFIVQNFVKVVLIKESKQETYYFHTGKKNYIKSKDVSLVPKGIDIELEITPIRNGLKLKSVGKGEVIVDIQGKECPLNVMNLPQNSKVDIWANVNGVNVFVFSLQQLPFQE